MSAPELFISAVVPVYNAEQSLEPLVARLGGVLAPLGPFELIFVDDGSTDQSLKVLRRLAQASPWGPHMRVAALGRNYGQQEASFVGFTLARGRYIASLDDDLQHPPEFLRKMLRALEDRELDIVYALPQAVRDPLRRWGAVLRDRLFAALYGGKRPVSVSSFRLMRRDLLTRVLQNRRGFFYFSAEVFSRPGRAGSLRYPYAARPLGASGYSLLGRTKLYLRILRRYHPALARFRPSGEGRIHVDVKEWIHVEASDPGRLQLSDKRLSQG